MRAERSLALVALLAVAGLGGAVAIACGDDEAPATPPPDVAPDAADGATTEPLADGGDADASASPGCRTAAAPSAACAASPTACERKTLYLSPSSTFPFAMVTDDANVYWVAQTGDPDLAYDGAATASILRVAKTGASTQTATVLAKDQPRATTLIKDDGDLYWIATEVTDAGSTSTLRRLLGATGTAQDVATFSGIARRLVRAAPGVFFTVDHQGNVRRLTKQGAVADLTKTSAAPSLAASNDVVFAGGGLFPRIERLPTAGGNGSPFFDLPDAGPEAGLPGAYVLGADCDRLYGIRDDEGIFFWSTAAMGALSATAATFDDATDIAADEGFVYVARRKGGGVARGARDGSGFASVYTGDVWRLAVDDEAVYWGEHGKGSLAGNVFMQTKK